MSQSKFIPTPAGTPVPAPTAVQSFARRQIFPRAPCTNDSFVGGKECQFTFRASGTDCLVTDQTRLVMKMHVRSNVSDNGAVTSAPGTDEFRYQPGDSLRMAQDPVARAFSSARMSIGGVTITNTGA